jgi:hypothetical protein
MKTYTAQLPVVLSAENECSRFFEHNLSFKIAARNQKDAVKRLEDLMTTMLTKSKKRRTR